MQNETNINTTKNKVKKNINLLWTGGWDSTFQLLQLLLIFKSEVTLFYLIHSERKSLGVEIRTMKRIKDQLIKDYPHTKELLKPIQYYTVSDISPDIEISEAYQSIYKKMHIGLQYKWLALLCKQIGITDMHLSIEAPHDPEEIYWDIYLDNILSEKIINSQTVYRVDEKYKDKDFYKIFQYFDFPIRKLTKIQTATIVNKQNWNKIMDLTWFCHNPTCNKKPCGKCKPCLMVIKSGFAWRIPPERRAISFYYRKIFWPLKSVIKSLLAKLGLFKKKSDRELL